MNQLLHTPEGVRDIYNDECERKIILEERLLTVLKSYGYHPIQTPTFEFFDIFGKEIGTTPSKDLYKFFDREGNTLVLRPDITPSIARCASKYYMEQAIPIRLCYTGNTFRNNSSYQGRLKENTQSGAELIGDGSVEADAEMLALSAQLLKTAGLKEFQLSVGHADFLRGLFEAANLEEDVMEEIRNLLLNRNLYGVQEVIEQHVADENLKQLFGLLTDVMLDKEKITAAKIWAADYPRVFHALTRLEELDELLEVYKIRKYVSYELAMISGFNYYTGIIFAGYTFGSGEAIVNGGRYDNLLQSFGKSAPSIGFAVVINQLMAALQRQNVRIPFENVTKWFIYSEQYRQDAIKDAQVLRSRGEQVELMPLTEQNTREVYETYAEQNHIQDIIFYM
ncbi:ATP phosphoribosyltransferase regulatory subunit [uncultured Eubacterium sp.]|uniref:ATP phosphoribosyltransferase regulatory subunit n=1 Tax=Eubacterium sp. TaxID=142586 RepID=UPI0025DD42F7|nr:ATP phosphoribosyltransferase regulatory subunit [uncultured Eubacterium sp.]